jgi:hypothetical protein
MTRHANPPRPAVLKHERRSAGMGHVPFADSQPPLWADTNVSGWGEDVIELLDDSLQTEMVCVLRYRRSAAPDTAETVGAERIADRIIDRITDRILRPQEDEGQGELLERPLDEADDFRAARPAEPLHLAGWHADDRDPPLRAPHDGAAREDDRVDPEDWLAR